MQIVGLLGLVLTAAAVAFVTRRVLGVPVGWILFILTKHGLGSFLRPQSRRSAEVMTSRASLARALTAALDDAGVTFVKVGQMLSARPDLVGPEFVRELSTLQSATTPVPWSDLEPALADALGAPPADVFSKIDPEPLAAASLGQVHAGTLRSGEHVVIKVRRPGAPAQVQADLDILRRIAIRLERSTGWARRLGVVDLAAGFAESLREELDYRVEAANTRAVASALPADSGVRVPHVFDTWSGETVLIMQRLAGDPVGEASAWLDGLAADRRGELAEELLRVALHQLLVTGTFHADLHPGNVLVAADGSLGMIDFGSVGRLDAGSREALVLLLSAVDHDRPAAATDALLDLLDAPSSELDGRALQRDVGQLIVRFRGGADTAGLINALFGVVTRHGFRVPGQVAAAFRTLASLEGTLRLIDLRLDLVGASRRQATSLAGPALSPPVCAVGSRTS